jgi:transposase-like protein
MPHQNANSIICKLLLVALSGRYSNPLCHPQHDKDAGQPAKTRDGRRQKQVRLSDRQITEVASLYQQGQTLSQVAEAFGVHKTTISDHLKHRGVSTRVVQRRLSDADVARAAELYTAGQSLAQVGKRFGVYDSTIRHEFKKAGISTRPRKGQSNSSANRQRLKVLEDSP